MVSPAFSGRLAAPNTSVTRPELRHDRRMPELDRVDDRQRDLVRHKVIGRVHVVVAVRSGDVEIVQVLADLRMVGVDAEEHARRHAAVEIDRAIGMLQRTGVVDHAATVEDAALALRPEQLGISFTPATGPCMPRMSGMRPV